MIHFWCLQCTGGASRPWILPCRTCRHHQGPATLFWAVNLSDRSRSSMRYLEKQSCGFLGIGCSSWAGATGMRWRNMPAPPPASARKATAGLIVECVFQEQFSYEHISWALRVLRLNKAGIPLNQQESKLKPREGLRDISRTGTNPAMPPLARLVISYPGGPFPSRIQKKEQASF